MTSKRNTKYSVAVGLDYDQSAGMAPIVNLKGEALVADEIVKLAHRYGIPVVEKPDVAQALKEIDLDSEIPEPLFRPVAIILNRVLKLFSRD